MEPAASPRTTLLLVEEDVILRLGLGEYLRACGYQVFEAAGAAEARTILTEGPEVSIIVIDAQLAGQGGGFALSKWTRKTRPGATVVLTGGLASKTEAAAKLCASKSAAPYSPDELKARIGAMRARQAISKSGSGRRKTKTSESKAQ